GSLVAASVGTLALAGAATLPPGARLANWYTWWLGDVAGMMVVTPFLLAWLRPVQAVVGVDHARHTERAAMAAALLATFAIVLALAEEQSGFARALSFMLIAFVAWAGCRFGERT